MAKDYDHFWKLFEDMDVPLFFQAWVAEDVHLLHSSELLESISVHDYVSTKPVEILKLNYSVFG